MMKNNTLCASFPYDGNTRPSQEGARNLANPTSFGSCQQPRTSADAVPVPCDGMASMAELMFSYGFDHGYSSPPLEHATEPGEDIHIAPPSFPQTNPNDPAYSRGPPKYNGGTQLDLMGQYLNNGLLTNPLTHAGTRRDHYLTPMAPDVPEFSFSDHILSLSSTLSNPSHDTPSSQLERSAGAALMAATPTKAYMDGPPGYHQGPAFEPFANTGPHNDVAFSAPLPYPSPDRMVQELRRLRLDSQGHIPPHLESDNLSQSFLNLPSGYGGPRCSSPDFIHEVGQGDPVSVPTLIDGYIDYPSTLDNRARRHGGHMPTRTQSERISEHRRGFTFPPYHIPNKTVVNEIRHPDPRAQVHTTGDIPDYVVNGQAHSTSMHTSAQDSVTASFPTFSENQYNYPTQRTNFWEGVGGPFSVASSTRMDREHCSGLYPDQASSSFTQPIYHSDMVVSIPSTSSFPGWKDNGMRSPQFSPKARLENLPLPRHTPPFQHHTPCQETFECTPDCSNPDEASSNSPNTAEEDHSTALAPMLADKEQNGSSLSPSTHPSVALRAQKSLRTILGPSSPLRSKALITLLRLILESSFVWTHEMEPRIESEHGQALLTQVKQVPDCPNNVFQLSRGSIYTAFVTYPEFVCWICGKPKQSMTRAIGCVRSHLDHRPFPCRGTGGCKSCPKDQIVRRFFTASLLHDHRSAKGTLCTSCGVTLRSSMKRHWDSQHPDISFPHDRYPRYRRAKLSHS